MTTEEAATASCCSGPNGVRYRHPPQALLDEIKRTPGITSVQITFHEDLPPERHSMPPGGFRLAVVNGFDLAAALAARERLKEHFLAVALPDRDGRSRPRRPL